MKPVFVLSGLIFLSLSSLAAPFAVSLGSKIRSEPIRATYKVTDPGNTVDFGNGYIVRSVRLEIEPKGGILGLFKPRPTVTPLVAYYGKTPDSYNDCGTTSYGGPECHASFSVASDRLYIRVSGPFGNSEPYVAGTISSDDVITFAPEIVAQPAKVIYQHGSTTELSLSVNAKLTPLIPKHDIPSRLPEGSVCDVENLSANYDYVSFLNDGFVIARGQVSLKVIARDGNNVKVLRRLVLSEEFGKPSSYAFESATTMTVEQVCPSHGLRLARNCTGIRGHLEKIDGVDVCKAGNPNDGTVLWVGEFPFGFGKMKETHGGRTEVHTYRQ